MPDPTPLQSAWLAFVDSVFPLLAPDLDDAALYQYVQFRDNVFALVKSQDFLDELQTGWPKTSSDYPQDRKMSDLLLLELRAFPLAMQATPPEVKTKKSWIRKWLGRGSTVTGSVKDSLENLPW